MVFFHKNDTFTTNSSFLLPALNSYKMNIIDCIAIDTFNYIHMGNNSPNFKEVFNKIFENIPRSVVCGHFNTSPQQCVSHTRSLLAIHHWWIIIVSVTISSLMKRCRQWENDLLISREIAAHYNGASLHKKSSFDTFVAYITFWKSNEMFWHYVTFFCTVEKFLNFITFV